MVCTVILILITYSLLLVAPYTGCGDQVLQAFAALTPTERVTSRHQTTRGGRVFAQQIRQGRERWSGESRYQKCLGLQNLILRSLIVFSRGQNELFHPPMAQQGRVRWSGESWYKVCAHLLYSDEIYYVTPEPIRVSNFLIGRISQ